MFVCLLRWKGKLPFNGDFIWVTLNQGLEEIQKNPTSANNSHDFKSLDLGVSLEVAHLIYERALHEEKHIEEISQITRDKAKTLFSSISIVASILIAIISLFIPTVIEAPLWLLIWTCSILGLMIIQFGRGIYLALESLIREEEIRLFPSEYSEMSKHNLLNVHKILIPRIFRCVNLTHERVNLRVNKVIIAQHSYRWGLLYFGLIFITTVVISISMSQNIVPLFANSATQTEHVRTETDLMDNITNSLGKKLRELEVSINNLAKRQNVYQYKVDQRINRFHKTLSAVRQKVNEVSCWVGTEAC